MKPSSSAGVRSMTGQGHATAQGDLGSLSVEVRTVNNRGLKCSARISDSLAGLESNIDALVRSLIHRGTVSISVSWRRPAGKDLPAIDQEALQAYAEQLQKVRHRMGDPNLAIDLSALVDLPGVVVSPREERRQDEPLWQFVRSGITEAVENLDQMREAEGANMAVTLTEDVAVIEQSLQQ